MIPFTHIPIHSFSSRLQEFISSKEADGAAKAKSITFVADGATWIWDRIDRIVSKAQIPATVKIHQILDNCYASHHISRALASLGFNDKERMAHYRVYRTMKQNGKWRQVVEDLSGVAVGQPDNKVVQTEIEYLKKHGEAGRLSYQIGRPVRVSQTERCRQ